MNNPVRCLPQATRKKTTVHLRTIVSSEKNTERQQRERKDNQNCHFEHGKHDRQRTRGRGFYGVKEGQHNVRPREKVEGSKATELGNGIILHR